MSNNIYDTANQLERDLRELPEYQAIQESFNKIKEDTESYTLFREFTNLTADFTQRQQQGDQIQPHELEQLERLSQQMSSNELVSQLVENEQKLSLIFNDINRIIVKPLTEIYEDLNQDA